MVSIEELKNCITTAMYATYDDLFKFSGDINGFYYPEYYLTSRIASQLAKNFINTPGNPYKIVLEEKTKNFSFACNPLMCINDEYSLGESPFNKPKDTNRSGKIDICVYKTDNGKESFCCIETKNTSLSPAAFDSDLKRMSELFSFESDTGPNSLQYAFLVFFHDSTKPNSRPNAIIKNRKAKADEYTNKKVKWSFEKLDPIEPKYKNGSEDEDYRENSCRIYCFAYIGRKNNEE